MTNRLREAREHVGFSLSEAAGFLGVSDEVVSDLENGTTPLAPEADGEHLGRLSKLYRRPIGWLRGERSTPVAVSEEVDRLMEGISGGDRQEVVAFLEYLGHAKELDMDAARPKRR